MNLSILCHLPFYKRVSLSLQKKKKKKKNRPSLVEDIFLNIFDKIIFSGNLLHKITEYLPNFIIIKNLPVKPRIKRLKSVI